MGSEMCIRDRSSIMGINMRTTMDIDANITGMDFEKGTIEEMINKIITVEIDDDVTFEICLSQFYFQRDFLLVFLILHQ